MGLQAISAPRSSCSRKMAWSSDSSTYLLRGTQPRLEIEHAHFVDAAFLPGDAPLVPFRYPRAAPGLAQASQSDAGELYFGQAEALDSSAALGGLCEREGLGPVALWVRAVNAERMGRLVSGYLRPWCFPFFNVLRYDARRHWVVQAFE